MPEPRCDCHDFLLVDCSTLLRAQAAVEDAQRVADEHRERLLARRRAIPAAYAGECGGCGEGFDEGEPISRDRDRYGSRWRASCCLDDTGRPVR